MKRPLSLRPALSALWLFALGRIVGGAALLWLLGAPAWAIAGWLMLHVKFSVRPSRTSKQSR